MSSCICIKNLKKKYYNTNYVISDFSYVFKSTGLYILFGESGSGKTTLLNIISGLTSFDEGEIYFNNAKHTQQLDKDYMSKYIAYITQDNYFVDYLNVLDNILLCSNDTQEINRLLEKFSLNKIVNYYPNELSGGERQRLSLVQAILKQKRIIILDEPTSALDVGNRKLIFELLNELKQSNLIICSTHDSELLKYSDDVIDFKNLTKYNSKNISTNTIKMSGGNLLKPVKNIYPFLKKQKKYNHRNIKVSFLLGGILVLCILMMFFCFNIDNKLIKTIQDKYHLNYLTIYCPIDNEKICENLFDSVDVSSHSFVYSLNIPLNNQLEEGSNGDIEFNTDLITLPFNKNDFPFLDRVKYGKYYSADNEVILGYDLALQYDCENPNNLIGSNITIKTPDGLNKFKIVGIFDYFSEIEKQYFKAGQVQTENIDSKYFVNSLFAEQYINDGIYGYNEVNLKKQVYYVYFNSFNKLYKNYNEFLHNKIDDSKIYVSSFPSQYLDIVMQFNTFATFLYPIFILSIIISLIFYYQVLQLDMKYRKHIFSVYQYYGYSVDEIKKATIKFNIINILIIYSCSVCIAMVIALIINFLNSIFNFVTYQLFSYDLLSVIYLFIFLMIISIFMAFMLSKNIKNTGWYQMSRDNGDLI